MQPRCHICANLLYLLNHFASNIVLQRIEKLTVNNHTNNYAYCNSIITQKPLQPNDCRGFMIIYKEWITELSLLLRSNRSSSVEHHCKRS